MYSWRIGGTSDQKLAYDGSKSYSGPKAESRADVPTPAIDIARLVRTYDRNVRSEARWSRATHPAFSRRRLGFKLLIVANFLLDVSGPWDSVSFPVCSKAVSSPSMLSSVTREVDA